MVPVLLEEDAEVGLFFFTTFPSDRSIAFSTAEWILSMSGSPVEIIGGTKETVRTGWLRAAVLGANDGLLSTASLMVGLLLHTRCAPIS